MLIVTQKVKKIKAVNERFGLEQNLRCVSFVVDTCLLYTSDAADE